MIYFDDLPLDKDILVALGELRINYVFQPIFQADGKTIYKLIVKMLIQCQFRTLPLRINTFSAFGNLTKVAHRVAKVHLHKLVSVLLKLISVGVFYNG